MTFGSMRRAGWLVPLGLLLAACESTPGPHALSPRADVVAQRRMQTRRFDTADEVQVLKASGALLQDLGFHVDASEDQLGVLTASKDRSAIVTGEVIFSVVAAGLLGTDVPYDHHQKLRASIVTHDVGKKSMAVRATFQRVVWNNKGQISKREAINDPEIYQEFFRKLSRALFLEAHDL